MISARSTLFTSVIRMKIVIRPRPHPYSRPPHLRHHRYPFTIRPNRDQAHQRRRQQRRWWPPQRLKSRKQKEKTALIWVMHRNVKHISEVRNIGKKFLLVLMYVSFSPPPTRASVYRYINNRIYLRWTFATVSSNSIPVWPFGSREVYPLT